jgi:hypothetical protein
MFTATAGATSVLWSPEETIKFSSHSHQDTFCDWTTLFKRCTVWILCGFCVDSVDFGGLQFADFAGHQK